MNSRLVIGSKTFLYINGQKWAKCTGFEFESVTPHKANMGLDYADPYELMVTTNQVRGQFSCVRSSGDGGIEATGLTAPFQYLPKQKYFSITLVDRLYDLVLFQAPECVVLSQKWQIPNKGIMMGQVLFEGLNWVNESFGYF
jgi:hypothetical protein